MNKMNKMNKMKILAVGAIISSILLSGCGNSWEMTKKNIASDMGTLKRDVVVYDSWTKETLWKYSGEIYLDSSSTPGNISIVYKDGRGKIRKNDFLGQHIAVVMKEIVELTEASR